MQATQDFFSSNVTCMDTNFLFYIWGHFHKQEEQIFPTPLEIDKWQVRESSTHQSLTTLHELLNNMA